MVDLGPCNSHYLEVTGDAHYVSKSAPVGDNNGHTIEFMVDFMPVAWPAVSPTQYVTFAGTYIGFGWFEIEVPAGFTTKAGTAKFGTSRNSVVKYSGGGAVTLGQRYRMLGKDNGTNVYAWLNGTALGSETAQTDWTAAQAARVFDTKGTFYLGFDDLLTEYFPIRWYEVWIKFNGVLILHYKPNENDTAKTQLTDLSGYGNHGTISGTLNTHYRWASAWLKNVAAAAGSTS